MDKQDVILEQLEFPFSDRRIDDIEDPTADEHYAAFFAATDSEDTVMAHACAAKLKKKFPEHPWPELMLGWVLMVQDKPGLARQHFFLAVQLGEKFRRRIDYCYEKMRELDLSDPWEDIIPWCAHLNDSKVVEKEAKKWIQQASEMLENP